MVLPTHQLLPKVAKALLCQRLGEDVCKLLCSVNGLDVNGFVAHILSEVVIFDSYVFCPRSKLAAICNLDAVLKFLTTKVSLS